MENKHDTEHNCHFLTQSTVKKEYKKQTEKKSTMGERLEQKVELQRKQGGRKAFPCTTHSSVDHQHRKTFCALKYYGVIA